MTREELMIVDNPKYPKGMVDELNAVIQKTLDAVGYENLDQKQQDTIAHQIIVGLAKETA
jgi:hypothetical protein